MRTSYAVSSDYNAAFSNPAVLREGIGNVKTKAPTLPFHAKYILYTIYYILHSLSTHNNPHSACICSTRKAT